MSTTAGAGIAFESVTRVAARLRSRELSATELVRSTLDRIHALNPQLNAFITVSDDQALAAARAVDDARASGSDVPLLAGIPVAVKDNFATKGIRTTAASPLLTNWVPDADAAVVTRLKHAGAVIVGKTNLSEFGRA